MIFNCLYIVFLIAKYGGVSTHYAILTAKVAIFFRATNS